MYFNLHLVEMCGLQGELLENKRSVPEIIGGPRGRHTKFSKRNRLGSARPLPLRGPRPQREILDPPLEMVIL